MAENITQGYLQPAAQQVAEQAVPTAKEFTEGQLQPAARMVAENVSCPDPSIINSLCTLHLAQYIACIAQEYTTLIHCLIVAFEKFPL